MYPQIYKKKKKKKNVPVDIQQKKKKKKKKKYSTYLKRLPISEDAIPDMRSPPAPWPPGKPPPGKPPPGKPPPPPPWPPWLPLYKKKKNYALNNPGYHCIKKKNHVLKHITTAKSSKI